MAHTFLKQLVKYKYAFWDYSNESLPLRHNEGNDKQKIAVGSHFYKVDPESLTVFKDRSFHTWRLVCGYFV